MLKRTISMVGLVALLAFVSSCIFDADEKDTPVVPPQGFEELTTREAVLNNIEVAYEKRRIQRYEELLDLDFTFFLSDGDVGGGLPVSWGRAEELIANENLFSQDPPAPFPRCKRIQMDVKWEDGLSWSPLIPDPNEPDVEWFTTTVNYEFKIDVDPDMTYLNNPTAQAQFTVRNIGTDADPAWRLVEFRDLGD